MKSNDHPIIATLENQLSELEAERDRYKCNIRSLIDGAECEGPYANEHGYFVREVCECDYARLKGMVDE